MYITLYIILFILYIIFFILYTILFILYIILLCVDFTFIQFIDSLMEITLLKSGLALFLCESDKWFIIIIIIIIMMIREINEVIVS